MWRDHGPAASCEGPLVGAGGPGRAGARARGDNPNGRAAAVLNSPEDLAELEETLAVLGDAHALSDAARPKAGCAGLRVLRGVEPCVGPCLRSAAENPHPRSGRGRPWLPTHSRPSRRPSSIRDPALRAADAWWASPCEAS